MSHRETLDATAPRKLDMKLDMKLNMKLNTREIINGWFV
jgi:hypothetical protein